MTRTVKCMDCGLPYKRFGLDTRIPRSQWMQINPEEKGMLCANCIMNRASKIPNATCAHIIIEISR